MNYFRFLFLLSVSCVVTAMKEKQPEWNKLGISQLDYTKIYSLKEQFAK